GQDAIERSQQRQEPQQLSFGVAQRNQPRYELTKDSRQDQSGCQRNKQCQVVRRKPLQRDVSDEDRECDQENLNRRRERKAEARPVLENLFEERRVPPGWVFFGFGCQTSQ